MAQKRLHVVYLEDDVPGCVDRVILAPASFIKDNKLTYSSFPLSEDDMDVINSFLGIPNPVPPPDWPKYTCTILCSFGIFYGETF